MIETGPIPRNEEHIFRVQALDELRSCSERREVVRAESPGAGRTNDGNLESRGVSMYFRIYTYMYI